MTARHCPPTFPQACRHIKTSFQFRGQHCAATLYLPADHDGDSALPAILMVHGWGGVQRAFTPAFCQRFVREGWAVMEFDYPGWGASEGWPRQDIHPWTRVRAAEAALAHLKSRPEVDASRIVLWGTSFGGGHVIDIAAQHPELLGAIAQVPMLDGRQAVRAVPLPRLLAFTALALADLLLPGSPRTLPVVAPPGKFASMDRDGAAQALELAQADRHEHYDNRVRARSMLTMGLYRPVRRLAQLNVPTLVVGALGDSVAPFDEKAIRAQAPACVQIQTLDANHFDPYFLPCFTPNIEHQLRFLRAVLLQRARA